jgi:hypothetical protein
MTVVIRPFRMLFAALLAALSTQAVAVGGLADVHVYDRSDGRQLQVYWHEGRAWVVGRPGNEYSVRIRNRGREDVLAVVSVDGVNAITGETASPHQSGYVLSPWRTMELSGWRRNLASTAAFYFTSLSDSYAARTGRPDNVGVIGVALYRKKNVPPPPAEIAPFPRSLSRQAPEASVGSADAGARADRLEPHAHAEADMPARRYRGGGDFSRDQKLGTGHGRVEASQAQYVGFERATHYPAETVSIYYDRYENLVARGIVPHGAPHRPGIPRPFPGFVADPPA